MELIPFFSMAILIATIASVVLAVVSYLAYKAREGRRPNRRFRESEMKKMVFFHRYDPSHEMGTPTGETPGDGSDGHPEARSA